LDLLTSIGTPRTFINAAGTFKTDKMIKLAEAMLTCISTGHTFTLELMIIPNKCSSEMNYGAIIGQESM
jgi:hypothetical protein